MKDGAIVKFSYVAHLKLIIHTLEDGILDCRNAAAL
jgi:hypothetical protein